MNINDCLSTLYYHHLLLFQGRRLASHFTQLLRMLGLVLHLHVFLIGAVHHQQLMLLLLDDGLLLLKLGCRLLDHLLLLHRLLLDLTGGGGGGHLTRLLLLLVVHAHPVRIVQ